MNVTVNGRVFANTRPGPWEIDLTHFPRPVSSFVQEFFFANFGRGFAEGAKLYGLLLENMSYQIVNGFMYSQPKPVGAPEGANGAPPKPLFKLLTWLHPEVRSRIARSKDAIATRAWIGDLEHWDNTVKPQAIRENLAIQAVDPSKLSDSELADHLRAAAHNSHNAIYRHGRFTMTACLPVGDFLAHAKRWTGEENHILLGLVRGWSAISNGAADAELRKLAQLLRGDAAATALLDRPPQAAIDALCAAPGTIGEAARAYIEAVGNRIVTGYDVTDLRAIEMPETLVRSLKAAVADKGARGDAQALEREVARIRDKVPEAERTAFDALLADARTVYRLRDERDHFNDGWATGLTRRALLEAGKRLAQKGRIDSPELVLDATLDETLAMLAGSGGPSADELRERASWRTTVDPTKVPQTFGPAPKGPPPADWLPPPAARFARAIDIFLFSLFQPSDKESSAQVVRGIPVSPGVYEGPARVVLGAEDFANVQQGDVLIARSTSPYFNVLLPLLGGIVTDRGGSLSHAAIVAREYGIPGVVGTKTGTQAIRDGQRVRIDGNAGEVQVL